MPPKKTAPPKAVEKVEREEEQDDFVDEDGLPTWGRGKLARAFCFIAGSY